MRSCDLENFVCESIYNPRSDRFKSESGVLLHQYDSVPID
jgi:hypothetical protein